MTTIEKVLQKLQKYPRLSHRVSGDSITIDAPSPNGFSVFLESKDGTFTVGFDGWHEHFDSESDALNCFAFGLIGKCRLKVCRRGKSEYRWTLEYPSSQGWEEDSTTGLLFYPFWRRPEVIYRQNPVIDLEASELGVSV